MKMTEAERLQIHLDEQLRAAGFDRLAPDLWLAWRAFKSFVEGRSPKEREGMGMAIEHFADRDNVLWFEFSLSVCEARGSTGIGISFSRPIVQELVAVHAGLFFWADEETSLADFWKQVEAEPQFQAAMALPQWEVAST